jgi:hypothetical protein
VEKEDERWLFGSSGGHAGAVCPGSAGG